MPRATAGKGRTATQRLRGAIASALAGAGYVEVPSSPFGSAADFDRLQLPPGDSRRRAVLLANPIRDEEPQLRTTLLPGLFRVALRNAGRGFADLSLFEIGNVARSKADLGDGSGANGHPGGGAASRVAPILPVDRGPTPEEVAELERALPDQPRLVGVVLTGQREAAGWWGDGRPASFHDAIEAAHTVLRTSRVPYSVRAGQLRAVASGAVRGVRHRGRGRLWRGGRRAGDGRLRRRAAPQGHQRVPARAEELRGRARPFGDRTRGG